MISPKETAAEPGILEKDFPVDDQDATSVTDHTSGSDESVANAPEEDERGTEKPKQGFPTEKQPSPQTELSDWQWSDFFQPAQVR